jgi:hypothetical protein
VYHVVWYTVNCVSNELTTSVRSQSCLEDFAQFCSSCVSALQLIMLLTGRTDVAM